MDKKSTPHPETSIATLYLQYNKLDVVKAIAPHLFSCSRRNLRRIRAERKWHRLILECSAQYLCLTAATAPSKRQTRKNHTEPVKSVQYVHLIHILYLAFILFSITAISTQDLAEAVTVLKADIANIIRGRSLKSSSNSSKTNREVDVLTARLDKIMADVQGMRQ